MDTLQELGDTMLLMHLAPAFPAQDKDGNQGLPFPEAVPAIIYRDDEGNTYAVAQMTVEGAENTDPEIFYIVEKTEPHGELASVTRFEEIESTIERQTTQRLLDAYAADHGWTAQEDVGAEEEVEESSPFRECPTCKGTGMNAIHPDDICDTCHGSGELPGEPVAGPDEEEIVAIVYKDSEPKEVSE
jgi:hypothetical protein